MAALRDGIEFPALRRRPGAFGVAGDRRGDLRVVGHVGGHRPGRGAQRSGGQGEPLAQCDDGRDRVAGRGERGVLWVAATERITMCWVADGRGFAEATEVIKAGYDGVLVRDGWIVYRSYTKAQHQTCTAHLVRRCVEMETDMASSDRATPAAAKAILLDGLAARDLPEAERASAAAELTLRMAELCAQPQAHDANRRLLAHLAKESDALFTYLGIDGVDATNWKGESGVRPCVVNRKTWGGNRTWRGAKTQGVITSVIATAAKNGVDAIAYLAARARSPDPGLAILLG